MPTARPGLRDQKKLRTRQEILANAIALFRERGIRQTRTSLIARTSEVSAGTLFNYFPTKPALVEAWVRGELDEVLRRAADAIGERGLRPMLRVACRDLVIRYREDAALRREAWRVLPRARATPPDAAHPIYEVAQQEQQRERVRKDLSAQVLTELLLDALESGLIALVEDGPESTEDGPSPDREGPDPVRALQARLDLILDGLRKKNERVAAPKAGAGGPLAARARVNDRTDRSSAEPERSLEARRGSRVRPPERNS